VHKLDLEIWPRLPETEVMSGGGGERRGKRKKEWKASRETRKHPQLMKRPVERCLYHNSVTTV
jgi:hypothetical protein